jgi:hypothetical protein
MTDAMKVKEALMPCRFCKSRCVTLYECTDGNDITTDAWVECDDCFAKGPPGDTTREATSKWNTCAPSPAAPEPEPRVLDLDMLIAKYRAMSTKEDQLIALALSMMPPNDKPPMAAALDPVTVQGRQLADMLEGEADNSGTMSRDELMEASKLLRALIGQPLDNAVEPSGFLVVHSRAEEIFRFKANAERCRDQTNGTIIPLYASPSNPQETDPEVIWDAYYDEVPNPDDRSPQGAMAFALHAVSSTDKVKS